MTIASATIASSGSACNGATVTFSFSASIADYGAVEAEDQIQVLLETVATGARSLLTRGASAGQYSVSINGDQTASPGGSITTVSTYSNAYKIWIRLAPSYLQTTDLANQSAFNAETIESQFDQMQRQINVLKDQLRRAPVMDTPVGASFTGEITGPFTPGYALILNEAGTGFAASAAVPASTASAAELNLLDGATATVTIALSNGDVVADAMRITVTAKDAAGDTVAGVHEFVMHMSEAATGIGLTADTYSGDLTASTGAILGALTAKKAWVIQTATTGIFIGKLVDSARPADQYVVVKKPIASGVVVSSASSGQWSNGA